MYQKFVKALSNLHRDQRGITGLETAIILIAFVTVASVLAYSVLSAGIFSAERGKETVYKGLESAQSTMEVVGSVIGTSTDNTSIATVQIKLGLSIPNEKVDTGGIVLYYYDEDTSTVIGSANFTVTKSGGSTERGTGTMLEQDEIFDLTITTWPGGNVTAYDWFTVQILPPTGAALTITRTLPGSLAAVMDLK